MYNTEMPTVDSRYYDTAGIWKMYQYIQTIDITSLNLYCLVMVGIQIWYRNTQYSHRIDIVITRDYYRSCDGLIIQICTGCIINLLDILLIPLEIMHQIPNTPYSMSDLLNSWVPAMKA